MSTIHRHAFTLLEVMIAVALLSMTMVLVTQSLESSIRFNDRFSRQTDINNRANDVLNKLSLQLRLASNDKAAQMELPGPVPPWFTPADPANASKVVAYHFAMSRGLSVTPPTIDEIYEPFKRMIIYDGSTTPGRILLQTFDDSGTPNPIETLTIDVAENGFSLQRIGNTLQMSLTLRSETRNDEEILYTAQAQTIFIRSSMNESSGRSATPAYPYNITDSSLITPSPSIMTGRLVVPKSDVGGTDQVAIFFTAPIGQELDPKSITIAISPASDKTNMTIVGEGQTVTLANGVSLTRRTQPDPKTWPSRNGTYSVTLEGAAKETFYLRAAAMTTTGAKEQVACQYN